MSFYDISKIAGGFAHASFGSQEAFRAALNALSHPGHAFDVPLNAELPSMGYGSSAALLLGILDADTCVWLSPHLAQSDAAPWLRFHTGCQLVEEPRFADFLWINQRLGDTMPPLGELMLGSDEYPEHSATCVIEVDSFDFESGDQSLTLSGPGIEGTLQFHSIGLPLGFEMQWASNHSIFPRGVDVLFTTQTQVIGLPRTTLLSRVAKESICM
jgi:alpha-D-ribose 1-methylphosphonate 5-triphosphate synthase subunit PhnH